MICGIGLLLFGGCGSQSEEVAVRTEGGQDTPNAVIENILSRRSVRKYKPQPISRDTMEIILKCGINAPNGQNKQSWEIRVVDNPAFIHGLSNAFLKGDVLQGGYMKLKNMFRDVPVLVFIANDLSYDMSPIDCGLLGENMILSAWSMGIGSCCLGGLTRFLTTDPDGAEYLKRLDFPEGYRLLYCISFGYADESPAAKHRKTEKYRYIE